MRWRSPRSGEAHIQVKTWRGPVEYVSLLDATWQGEPEWGDDVWVAMDAPDLVYDGPPFPGVLVRVGVAQDQGIRVALCDSVPEWVSLRVAASELLVGDHGLYLEAGDAFANVPLGTGTYPFEVWVDPCGPGRATGVAFVFGPRQPRRLGKPRT